MNPEYEEIIIVSASFNTEITLPPVCEKLEAALVRNDSPLSVVIKSSSLLSNINNTITKTSVVKISSNSLLSSIQDVVLKQSTTTLLNGNQPPQKSPNIGVSPPSQFSPQKPEMSSTDKANPVTTKENPIHAGKELEHGEDKIIMHLRKDRIRKKTFSIAIQTDDLPQFPPSPLISLSDKYCQSANTKKRKRHYRSRRDSSASSVDNDDYRSSSRSHLRYRSVSINGTKRSISPRSSRYSYSSGHRTASPYHKARRRSSRNSSRTKYGSDSSDSGRRSRSRERRTRRYSSSHSSSSSSGSSDSSSRSRSRSRLATSRSRSRSRYSSVNQRRLSNYQRRTSSPAVEERRIVYVGRIERETSKEDLKRKFIAYGPIKQITVHYKDTGMKYEFVTFEKAQDASTGIDGSAEDPRINMHDISFSGRRTFCRATYSDLGHLTTPLQQPARPGILAQMILGMLHHLLMQLHTYVQCMPNDHGECDELSTEYDLGPPVDEMRSELSIDKDEDLNASSLLCMSSQPLPVPNTSRRSNTEDRYSAADSTGSDNIVAQPSSSHKSNYSITQSASLSSDNFGTQTISSSTHSSRFRSSFI